MSCCEFKNQIPNDFSKSLFWLKKLKEQECDIQVELLKDMMGIIVKIIKDDSHDEIIAKFEEVDCEYRLWMEVGEDMVEDEELNESNYLNIADLIKNMFERLSAFKENYLKHYNKCCKKQKK